MGSFHEKVQKSLLKCGPDSISGRRVPLERPVCWQSVSRERDTFYFQVISHDGKTTSSRAGSKYIQAAVEH